MTSKDLAKISDNKIVVDNKYLFGGLTKDPDKEQAVALIKAGFDPALHLQVHHGKPWVNIKGAYWWANQRQDKKFGAIDCKPIPAENKADYGVKDWQIGVIASLYLEDARILPNGTREAYCTGFGRASEDPRRPVVNGSAVEHQHTYLMSEKRAEYKALFKFHPPGATWSPSVTVEPEDSPITVAAHYTIEEKDDLSCPIHEGHFFERSNWWVRHLDITQKGPKGGKVWCNQKDAWAQFHDAQSKAQNGREQGSEVEPDVQGAGNG